MKKKVALINYLNTAPFLEGMNTYHAFENEFEIIKAVPSVCAQYFKNGDVDVAIVPVGALDSIGEYQIVSDFCIGANAAVKTVAVFAQKPLEQIDCIYLDTDSRSSVKLLKILLAEFWHLSPALKSMQEFKGELLLNEALLCIGDKTFPMLNQYSYQYDLADAWNKYTGLPFVFALWVQNGSLTPFQCQVFNKALTIGIDNRTSVAAKMHLLHPEIDFQDYYFSCINYNLDTEKLKAIHLFLEKSKNYD